MDPLPGAHDAKSEDGRFDGRDLSMETDVSRLPLTTKERNSLDVLGIKTVGEFLELDLERALDLRGYGQGGGETRLEEQPPERWQAGRAWL